jgi:hypothetical protein
MEPYPCDVQVWWWFELAITPTLVPGWNVVIIISIIIVLVADIVDLRIGATGEVGWTLVVFLTVVLMGIRRGGHCERGRKRTLRCLWTMSFMSAEQYW